MQCILVKSDEFENSYPLLYILFKSCLYWCSLATLAAQQQFYGRETRDVKICPFKSTDIFQPFKIKNTFGAQSTF